MPHTHSTGSEEKEDDKDKASEKSMGAGTLMLLLEHYNEGRDEMEQRKNRKNGWDDAIKAYLNKLPNNWPYNAKVTDPRIRTSITEKTARLLNAKLRGSLVAREGGDERSARVNNAVLEFQWDAADRGGSMLEKVAKLDQMARIFGIAYGLNWWDSSKEGNEMRPLDPKNVFVDPAAEHIREARWVQIREYVTLSELKDRAKEQGFKVPDIDIGQGDTRRSEYVNKTREIRGLEEKEGTDPANPTLELMTEFIPNWATSDKLGRKHMFLPKRNILLYSGPNPHPHGEVPVSQLRYYPVVGDLVGESEIEPVISLYRAINAVLSGYVEQMNLSMRPPRKVNPKLARVHTMEYAPGAMWIMDDPNSTQEVQMGDSAIKSFNNTYPALVAAFNTAMGDQSLGVSNFGDFQDPKTATEVENLQKQQNNRDQYNQLYLAEFLKDMTMQWLANNQTFLFDDPSRHVHIIRIIGRDEVRDFEKMQLNREITPEPVIEVMAEQIEKALDDGMEFAPRDIEEMMDNAGVPEHAVILNPDEKNAENMDVRPKMEKISDEEAILYITPSDMEGEFDYIPDVESMAAGASKQQQEARKVALETARDQTTITLLEKEGKTFNFSDLLIRVLEDAGIRDAEQLFENESEQGILTNGATTQQLAGQSPSARPGDSQAGNAPAGAAGLGSVAGGSAPTISADQLGGIPGPGGV